MGITVHCDIVSAEEEIYSGLVEMVIAAGSEGDKLLLLVTHPSDTLDSWSD